jgi:flagellar hook-associated protein FlgK
VATVNASLERVAYLNARISILHSDGKDATPLMDERQQVIDRIASIIPIQEVARDSGKVALFSAEGAVLLMQGVPTVFKVEGEELHPQPVQTGATLGGWTEITAGLAVGDEIVTEGAFLLKSLALKSQMGEGHAH